MSFSLSLSSSSSGILPKSGPKMILQVRISAILTIQKNPEWWRKFSSSLTDEGKPSFLERSVFCSMTVCGVDCLLSSHLGTSFWQERKPCPEWTLSKERHVLTKQKTLLEWGAWVENSAVRETRRTALPCGLPSQASWGGKLLFKTKTLLKHGGSVMTVKLNEVLRPHHLLWQILYQLSGHPQTTF
ncbi:PREDICTED: uncharacterized protein LOC104999211 [Bison bison bison]|uniref:Uncharacterized protein LOC104999211 n=1 Tax=Bison bison bison TaxID=43346 RepID=A0A6P3IMC9_BISBB|nr:PREDICTED: uncharacterized protein LOC104999211 [Bison bison bison]